MTLVRWNTTPFVSSRDLPSIQEEVDRFFDGFLTGETLRGDPGTTFRPSVDIAETPEAFIIRADLPGVAQKDVRVSLTGDTLTLRGTRPQERMDGEGNPRRIERAYGVFERSFTLGAPVRADQVEAQVRDGVLELRVPKAEEARIREIDVQVG